jgi:hypothetical protein
MRGLAMGRPMPAPLVCIASSTLIDPAFGLHKRLQPHLRGLAYRSTTQRSPLLALGLHASRVLRRWRPQQNDRRHQLFLDQRGLLPAIGAASCDFIVHSVGGSWWAPLRKAHAAKAALSPLGA